MRTERTRLVAEDSVTLQVTRMPVSEDLCPGKGRKKAAIRSGRLTACRSPSLPA